MDKKESPVVSSRRRFLLGAFPAGTFLCFGCPVSSGFAQSPADPQAPAGKHKFQEDSRMTFGQVYAFAYQEGFIPVLKNLAKDIGHDRFIEMLEKASSEAAVDEVKRSTQNLPKKDLATSLADMKSGSYFRKHVVTYKFVEETDKAAEARITECLWAKTFREMDAADIGYATICYPDFAAVPAFNPKLKLTRTKTLMQGHNCCNHRWVMEG